MVEFPPDRTQSGYLQDRLISTLETSGSIRPVLDFLIPPGSMTESEIQELDTAMCASNDFMALAALMRNWQGLDADLAKLAASPVPCLSIIAEHDPLRARLDPTATSMTNLKIEILDGHYHMTAFRSPKFVSALKAFIAKHSSSTRSE